MAFLKKRNAILGIAVFILAAVSAFVFIRFDLATQLRIGVGWKAQILCSGAFVSGRDAAVLLREDVPVHPFLKFIGARIDYDNKEVRTSFLGVIKNRAIYHPRLGSVLLSGVSEDTIRAWPVDIPEPQPANPESVP